MYAGHRLIDVLIHGWDVAADHRPAQLAIDPSSDRGLLGGGATAAVAPLQGSGAFGVEVTDRADNDPQTSLLNALGRHP